MAPAALHLIPRVGFGRRRAKALAAGGLALLCFAVLPISSSGAATAPGLGTAESFAVLAGSTVTNDGPSVINGDLGVSPGTAVTGFENPPAEPGVVNGTIYTGPTGVAADAKADAAAAGLELEAAEQPCDTPLTGQDLGDYGVANPLLPGVYCFTSSAQLTGQLALDAGDDPDAVFIFQISSTLTTASGSSVLLVGAASPCNVFWRVGSATLGTGTDFKGTVIASDAITATTGTDVEGRLIALSAAVTLDTNVITTPDCSTGGTDGTGTDGTATDGGTAGTDGTATDGGTAGTDGTATDGGTAGTDGTATDGGTGGTESDGATDGETDGVTSGGSDGTAAGGADDGSGEITRGDLDRPVLPRTGGTLILALAGVAAISIGAGTLRMAHRMLVVESRRP